METSQETELQPQVSVEDLSPVNSTKAEKSQIQGLLSEARSTRDMLVAFRAAVETGMYSGGKMRDIVIGLSFVETILKQNQAHLHDLQERLEK